MNQEGAPEWLPTFLVPFFTLSYPTERPATPDSFVNSNYYTTGLLDGCFIITCIAIMAVLRDVFRVFVMEPFAHWFLTRKQTSDAYEPLATSPIDGQANGNANTIVVEKSDVLRKRRREERHIRRSVLRFAEQGWSFIYYSLQWSFGLVS